MRKYVRQPEPDISDEQLTRMLSRYGRALDDREVADGPTVGDRDLERTRLMVTTALAHIRTSDRISASHLTGFIQGVLLCKNIRTWEYLASDDTRI